ncbi:hypothetical protein Ssi03_39980 [Sphaerisporangium siamense]|uniref:Alpha-beta hydrolase superfamily lysophospholipase n=1 Tax=Sphaerisporangium siamense TaxID=795645 RepID=A0A7W7D652_9ACTN|nr:prolyl oligopeptidase family serine peptidase [Sphaerisporangium siamense]MBB4700846.1 alpha-beta hydrolase superfamily lysophospholipase [Sphaerisporangium siamense]GII86008.1 hypothetical protein Ssi03_39980 [Sphaerisporangium siamense]
MSAAATTAAPARMRISFRFSGSGRHAACLTHGPGGDLVPELWTFGARDRQETLPSAETVRTQPTATGDGRVLLLRAMDGHHVLGLAARDGGRWAERTLAPIPAAGLRLLPSAAGAVHPLGLAVRTTASGLTTLLRVTDRPLGLAPIMDLPGRFTTCSWLDESGTLLAGNLAVDGAVTPIVADLARRTWTAIAGEGSQLVLARAGHALVTCREDGAPWLAWGRPGETLPLPRPGRLEALDGAVLPVAVDPEGRRIALRVQRGARGTLAIYTPAADRVREVPTPPGVLHPAASWSRGGLRVACSTPSLPSGVITVDPDRPDPIRVSGGEAAAGDAHLETFPGPEGAIEAVVYGDWRSDAPLLLALHGGPESAWDLSFDPVCQAIAATGITIVAPNQRGSVGYGDAHRDALRGAWGVPDLADIRHLVRLLTRRRPPGAPAPMLYGVSYGAYLALLAAAADPGLWSRCAVIAPFLSGPRLHAEAAEQVRALIERLGGQVEHHDDLGPRDLYRLAPRITAPLLIVHGDRDPVIPVGQSRLLCERLDAARVTYLEISGGGHFPPGETGRERVIDRLTGFLTADPEERG